MELVTSFAGKFCQKRGWCRYVMWFGSKQKLGSLIPLHQNSSKLSNSKETENHSSNLCDSSIFQRRTHRKIQLLSAFLSLFHLLFISLYISTLFTGLSYLLPISPLSQFLFSVYPVCVCTYQGGGLFLGDGVCMYMWWCFGMDECVNYYCVWIMREVCVR